MILLTMVAWVIAAVIVRGKSKGSIAVVIQTVALATFQIASTVHIGVAISFPFPTFLGACATSWSSTSISASCKNQTQSKFYSSTASQVFSMCFQFSRKSNLRVEIWIRCFDITNIGYTKCIRHWNGNSFFSCNFQFLIEGRPPADSRGAGKLVNG